MLQLEVKVINTNPVVNHPFFEKCRSLYEYSWFVARTWDYLKAEKTGMRPSLWPSMTASERELWKEGYKEGRDYTLVELTAIKM